VVCSRFVHLCRYFRGQHHLEEIMYHENMRRCVPSTSYCPVFSSIIVTIPASKIHMIAISPADYCAKIIFYVILDWLLYYFCCVRCRHKVNLLSRFSCWKRLSAMNSKFCNVKRCSILQNNALSVVNLYHLILGRLCCIWSTCSATCWSSMNTRTPPSPDISAICSR